MESRSINFAGMNCKWSFRSINWQLVFICLLIFTYGKSQSAASGFKSLSKPEKHWVMMHPFIAKKAYHITEHVRHVTDSLEKAGVLTDGNGGQLDAFRHCYWMNCLVNSGINYRKARKLGKAHEKGNYIGWKNGKLEDATRPDSLMCDMDLKNNEVGIEMARENHNGKVPPSSDQCSLIIVYINSGNLVMMKKDESGNFYDCDGNMIDFTAYDGKWYIPKCEVKSNESIKRG